MRAVTAVGTFRTRWNRRRVVVTHFTSESSLEGATKTGRRVGEGCGDVRAGGGGGRRAGRSIWL